MRFFRWLRSLFLPRCRGSRRAVRARLRIVMRDPTGEDEVRVSTLRLEDHQVPVITPGSLVRFKEDTNGTAWRPYEHHVVPLELPLTVAYLVVSCSSKYRVSCKGNITPNEVITDKVVLYHHGDLYETYSVWLEQVT